MRVAAAMLAASWVQPWSMQTNGTAAPVASEGGAYTVALRRSGPAGATAERGRSGTHAGVRQSGFLIAARLDAYSVSHRGFILLTLLRVRSK